MTKPVLTRPNVWTLDGAWAEPILWYARGVAAMKSRPLNDPLSWRFFAAIHGFDPEKWQAANYFEPERDSLPSANDRRAYWLQCWHGSWYFLPWHRGYLIAFEAAIRAEIVALGGPADWTLPYWNYFAPGQQAIPSAFAATTWPGEGDNPLLVKQRYGRHGDGVIVIPLDDEDPELDITLDALDDPHFARTPNGGAIGFGGADTGSTHHRAPHGHLEAQPHDLIHVLIGGVPKEGLMSTPATAGLDPIFWLHHANIDRLWDVWKRNSPPLTHTDPTDRSWLQGPAAAGKPFVMPVPAASGKQGHQKWIYTPEQMSDSGSLGYKYDDYRDDGTTQRSRSRRRTGIAPSPRRRLEERELAMPESASSGDAELIGATRGPMAIVGQQSQTVLELKPDLRAPRGLRPMETEAEARPARVYLNLENITAARDGAILRVYIGGPGGVDEQVAGSVALFGAVPVSGVGGKVTDDDGLTVVLDVTDLVESLNLTGNELNELSIRVVPVGGLDAEANVRIGRLGLYRQGA